MGDDSRIIAHSDAGMDEARHIDEMWTGRGKCCHCGHTFTEGSQLARCRSTFIGQAEAEALWQPKGRDFSQVAAEPGIAYSILHWLMEGEVGEGALRTEQPPYTPSLLILNGNGLCQFVRLSSFPPKLHSIALTALG